MPFGRRIGGAAGESILHATFPSKGLAGPWSSLSGRGWRDPGSVNLPPRPRVATGSQPQRPGRFRHRRRQRQHPLRGTRPRTPLPLRRQRPDLDRGHERVGGQCGPDARLQGLRDHAHRPGDPRRRQRLLEQQGRFPHFLPRQPGSDLDRGAAAVRLARPQSGPSSPLSPRAVPPPMGAASPSTSPPPGRACSTNGIAAIPCCRMLGGRSRGWTTLPPPTRANTGW
jgi:hypothetical protein